MKGQHTELPWMAASAYSSVVGVPIVDRQGHRVANTAIPDMPKAWDELKKQAVIDAAFICTAVNTYPAVTELVEALERAVIALDDGRERSIVRSALNHYRELAGTSNEGAR